MELRCTICNIFLELAFKESVCHFTQEFFHLPPSIPQFFSTSPCPCSPTAQNNSLSLPSFPLCLFVARFGNFLIRGQRLAICYIIRTWYGVEVEIGTCCWQRLLLLFISFSPQKIFETICKQFLVLIKCPAQFIISFFFFFC